MPARAEVRKEGGESRHDRQRIRFKRPDSRFGNPPGVLRGKAPFVKLHDPGKLGMVTGLPSAEGRGMEIWLASRRVCHPHQSVLPVQSVEGPCASVLMHIRSNAAVARENGEGGQALDWS